MSPAERKDIKEAVREAVREEVPETLAEILSPMVKHNVRAALNNYRRQAIIGWIVSALALGLLFWSIQNQANYNTRANHSQDCILASLIRGVAPADPGRRSLYNDALHELDPDARCKAH